MSNPRITAIERTVICVPFTPRCEEWNALLVRNWRVVEIVEVFTDASDIMGIGETVIHYTWQKTSDTAVRQCIGRNAADLMWMDSIGAGLQQALFDIVGKTLGVPVHKVLGGVQVREHVSIAWWNTKMTPDVLALEAVDAQNAGYTYHKIKARPWIDPFAQVEAIASVTGSHYRIDMDWNDMLLSASMATPILKELQAHSKVALFEGPIPQRDIEGYKLLRRRLDIPIAIHAGVPPLPVALKEEMCDGFVVSECGATAAMRIGTVLAQFDKPFWTQPVGTGISTAWGCHLGAVLSHQQWPMISCMNNYADDMIMEPHKIAHGTMEVPTLPGLGVALDYDAVNRYRMDAPYTLQERRHIISIEWPGGKSVKYAYMAHRQGGNYEISPFAHAAYAGFPMLERQCWEDFLAGNQPIEPRGVTMRIIHDNTSSAFDSLHARCVLGPVNNVEYVDERPHKVVGVSDDNPFKKG